MTPKARKRRERHGAERRWYRYARDSAEIQSRIASASYFFSELLAAFAGLVAATPAPVRVGSVGMVNP